MSDFMNYTYPWIAVAVFVVSLIVGVIAAINEADDFTEIGLLVLLAVLGGMLAGGLWPITALVVAIVGPVYGGRMWFDWRNERAERKRWAEAQKPREPSDAERYAGMAREQRNLARGSRDNGWDDTAAMQDQLAEQYEQLSRMYERTAP